MDNEEAGSLAPPTRATHIGKRARRNKSVTVSFDEKDLRYREISKLAAVFNRANWSHSHIFNLGIVRRCLFPRLADFTASCC